jgi:hypothetical protein
MTHRTRSIAEASRIQGADDSDFRRTRQFFRDRGKSAGITGLSPHRGPSRTYRIAYKGKSKETLPPAISTFPDCHFERPREISLFLPEISTCDRYDGVE